MRKPLTELKRTYRLLNHGPTTLITSAHDGKVNIMAAAWVMAVDFDPPKIAAINLPTAAQAELTYRVGTVSRARRG
jgi:flavin reductase (DIM6/NTAB) family NADH-FMN oxidoreductase RutF